MTTPKTDHHLITKVTILKIEQQRYRPPQISTRQHHKIQHTKSHTHKVTHTHTHNIITHHRIRVMHPCHQSTRDWKWKS